MVDYSPVEETRKRLELAERVTANYHGKVNGIVLVGSVAYGANEFVTEKSDLDILMVTPNLDDVVRSDFVTDKKARDVLKYRYFDGYSFKDRFDGVDLSIHLFSPRIFDLICGPHNGELRLFRQQEKGAECYELYNFEGGVYNFKIKTLVRLDGTITVKVPMSFIHGDRYHVGIHRDKLLSNPVILFENEDYMSKAIGRLWEGTVTHLRDEAMRQEGVVNLNRVNVLNALSRKDKLSKHTRDMINARTISELMKICPDEEIVLPR